MHELCLKLGLPWHAKNLPIYILAKQFDSNLSTARLNLRIEKLDVTPWSRAMEA